MTSHLDDAPDIPPPPYSEMDIYGNPDSHGHSPVVAQSQTFPSTHPRTSSHSNFNGVPTMDDTSSAASTSEVVYTPPLSTSSSQSQSFRGNTPSTNNLLSPGIPSQQQNTVSNSSEHLTSASAEAYFDSRPVPASCDSNEHERHNILVKEDSSPDDYPYNHDWAHRDIKEDDWQTFLNYLFPNHAAQRNEAVIDRKLRAECLNIDDTESARNRSEKSATDVGLEERSPVETQLDQIRTPDLQQRQNIEDTVREWNDGFFGPRGMMIDLEATAVTSEGYRMPCTRDQCFSNNIPDFANAGTRPVDRRGPSGPPSQTDSAGRWRRFNPINRSGNANASNGLHIGGLSIDAGGVAIGRNLVANPNSLSVGGVVMDSHGVRTHGVDRLEVGRSTSPTGGHTAATLTPLVPLIPSVPNLPRGLSHGPEAYYTRLPPPPPGFTIPNYPPGFFTHNNDEYPNEKAEGHSRGPDIHHSHHHRVRHNDNTHRRGRGTGRYNNGNYHNHRSRSSSSSLSSSSSSSSSSLSSSGSDSDASVGSLPDYDDLEDSQLPVTQSYLEDWLSRPGNFVTRDAVKEAKEEIKAAKTAAPEDISDAVGREAMRQQVRKMMGQWKVLKREQRNVRRKDKREKKARRRAEKRERRQARRERKRARRETRRKGRQVRHESQGPRYGGRHDHGHDHGQSHGHMHGGSGPFGASGPLGGPGALLGTGGRDFPGVGFGPGARERRGYRGPQGPFQTGPLPFGGRGGVFPPGPPNGVGPGTWADGFTRSMEDWSRRMSDWSRGFSATHGWPGNNGQPTFPGAWPAEAEHDQQQDRGAASRDGQQEDGIQPEGDDDGPHAASSAIYRSLEAKREALQGKRDALADLTGDTHGEDSQGQKQGALTLVDMLAEIEELEKAVSRLGLEADEQFAKELAALDD